MRISLFRRHGAIDLNPVYSPSPDECRRLKRLDCIFFAGLDFMGDGGNDSRLGLSEAFGAQ